MNTATEQRVLVPFEVIQDGTPKVNRIEEVASGDKVKALVVVMDTEGDILFSAETYDGAIPPVLTFSSYCSDDALTNIRIPSLAGWKLWAEGTDYEHRTRLCFVKL